MRPQSVAAIKRKRTARLARMITRAYYLNRKYNDGRMYGYVCEEFMKMGGVYIKFLQGVLLKSEIMRRWHNPERLKIFENLDSEPLDVVAILRHELPPEKLSEITGINPEPFAAGSFGQVYYGTHVSGKPIVVKVLRPMVRELLRYDLKLLSAFTKRFYGHMMSNMDMDINQAIREFVSSTLRETDYVAEAEFANELYQYYKNNPKLVIPETFIDLCTPNIIVQEYIEGISVAQIVKLQEQGIEPVAYVAEKLGSDLDTQLETLGFEAINGIFNLPRIQGDPHPGNIRLMTENRVGVIDFGISASTPYNKAAFFGLLEGWSEFYQDSNSIVRIFEQFMRFFASDLYRALRKLSNFVPGERSMQTNFTAEIGQIAQAALSEAVGTRNINSLVKDGRILQVINRMVNKDNRFGLVMKLEASEIIRAAQTYMTLVEALGRQSVVLPKVLRRVVEQVRQEHPELMHGNSEDSMSISDAIDTVSNWLERVAERDPKLFQQLLNKARGNKVMDIKGANDA